MTIALVAPGRAMLAARNRAALWRPLRDTISSSGGGSSALNAIAGLTGWWDAGTFDGMLDMGGRPLPS